MAGKRRARLFAENPLCFYCGVETTLDTKRNLPNMATIEHLFPRLHPRRREPNTTGERRLVLACSACNNAKSVADAKIGLTESQFMWRNMDLKQRRQWFERMLQDIERFDCF